MNRMVKCGVFFKKRIRDIIFLFLLSFSFKSNQTTEVVSKYVVIKFDELIERFEIFLINVVKLFCL